MRPKWPRGWHAALRYLASIPVETVVNDGSLDDGLKHFLAALNRAAADAPG